MRLKKKIARVKFKNGRSHQGLLTYLDDTDCWSIRGRTLTASIVFQLIEVVNVFAISERGSSTSALWKHPCESEVLNASSNLASPVSFWTWRFVTHRREEVIFWVSSAMVPRTILRSAREIETD